MSWEIYGGGVIVWYLGWGVWNLIVSALGAKAWRLSEQLLVPPLVAVWPLSLVVLVLIGGCDLYCLVCRNLLDRAEKRTEARVAAESLKAQQRAEVELVLAGCEPPTPRFPGEHPREGEVDALG